MLIQRHQVPVIAMVNGLATAAGCQLVASCDIAVASDKSSFATPGVDVGLFCSTPAVALGRAVPKKVTPGLPQGRARVTDDSTGCLVSYSKLNWRVQGTNLSVQCVSETSSGQWPRPGGKRPSWSGLWGKQGPEKQECPNLA